MAGALAPGAAVSDPVTVLNIATINNPDMIELQKLAPRFERENPDIRLNWIVMDEGVLRQRVTTDITTSGGQFDLMTIGLYEVPIWAQKEWLVPMTDLPASYDEADLLQSVREGLSSGGRLYALPFYAESSMTYYRKDLFEQKKLAMPIRPTWDDIASFAAQLHDPANGVNGICLRGRPGWGENMALIGTMVNTYGGRWFDEQWQPQIDSPEWKQAVGLYVDLMRNQGPADAVSNGFNENLALFSAGKCAIWVDATVAAGILYRGKDSRVADKIAFAAAPVATTDKGAHWLWTWALGIPHSSKSKEAAKKFAIWATSKEYIRLVAGDSGWALVPPGTRMSTYASAEYRKVAPFSDFVLNAIRSADPDDATLKPVPYIGVQFASIPEFQSIGTFTGQAIARTLSGRGSVDSALQASQAITVRLMQQGRYIRY
ncbi:sugar ABC transporter substrate-binding protein [Herbaspirillum sp. RV1423]|uniref:ABC transporter substrate-binding protein n=1 Tax=Herbaspirillum sp. RV1423 TaxID=1443993 RepID=UPI001E4023B4|nr:sugar ABC transporter substrate-binding protein [Herbaspirillum sp. RV1423]